MFYVQDEFLKFFVFSNYMVNIFSFTGDIFWLWDRLLGKEQNKMELFKL